MLKGLVTTHRYIFNTKYDVDATAIAPRSSPIGLP